MTWDTLPERFFSVEFISKLIRVCRIDETKQEQVHARLERAAKDWYFCQATLDNGILPDDEKKELLALAREAHALKERLTNLPYAVWANLVETNDLVSSEHYETRIDFAGPYHPDHGYIGERAITVLTSGPDGPLQTIEDETLISALYQLSEMASIASDINPSPNLATQKSEPLRRWTVDMKNLWFSVLDRPFTLDVYQGEAASDAARFCVAAYAVLDPETAEKTILGKMKIQITKDNRRPKIKSSLEKS